jgi:hypothetical protein
MPLLRITKLQMSKHAMLLSLATILCLLALLLPYGLAQAAVTLNRAADLSFGFAVAGSGTVTMSPTGARSASGGAVLFNQGSGATGQPAEFNFTISGEPVDDAVCTIELPDNTVYVGSGTNGAINSFTINRSKSIQLSGGAASGSFKVGGTLSLSGLSARSQAYSSHFSVSILCPPQ